MIDGRIVGATEDLVRKAYKLSKSYEPIECVVKRSHVTIEMSNGLINLKIKIPRDIIEDQLSGECVSYMLDGGSMEPIEEDTPSEESDESLEEKNEDGETNEATEEQDDLKEGNMEQIDDTSNEAIKKGKKRRIVRHGKDKKKESK